MSVHKGVPLGIFINISPPSPKNNFFKLTIIFLGIILASYEESKMYMSPMATSGNRVWQWEEDVSMFTLQAGEE
jgi:hypothetical protein